jgi:hypothetical protein
LSTPSQVEQLDTVGNHERNRLLEVACRIAHVVREAADLRGER